MRYWKIVGCALCAICSATVALASDSRVNPGTGFIETVESFWNGTDHDVRHIEDPGPGSGTITVLADGSDPELDPRIEIDPAKDTWVVYWRDASTPEVLLRRHDYSAGTWGPERVVSDTSISSSRPVVAIFDSEPWAAYEETVGGTSWIEVGIIQDEADPINSVSSLGSTTYSSPRDVKLHSEAGNLWATWIDSATDVAWAEYDPTSESWSSSTLESYASDSVGLARKRIRLTVLAN